MCSYYGIFYNSIQGTLFIYLDCKYYWLFIPLKVKCNVNKIMAMSGGDLNYVHLQLGFVFVDRFSFTYWVQGNKMIFGTHAARQTSPIYKAILLTKDVLNAVVWG